MHISWQFKSDIKNELKSSLTSQLKALGLEVNEQDILENLVLQYNHYKVKMVTRKRRNVLFAKEFDASKLNDNQKVGLKNLVQSIKNGDSLRSYMSRSVLKNGIDNLLFQWNIQHFHLNDRLCENGFVERSGPLAHVLFDDNNAYFLGVWPHGEWDNPMLIQIIYDNWPEKTTQLGDAKGEKPLSEQEIKKLRKLRINTLGTSINGSFIHTGGAGINADGTSSSAQGYTIHLIHNQIPLIEKNAETVARSDIEEWLNKYHEKINPPPKGIKVFLNYYFEPIFEGHPLQINFHYSWQFDNVDSHDEAPK